MKCIVQLAAYFGSLLLICSNSDRERGGGGEGQTLLYLMRRGLGGRWGGGRLGERTRASDLTLPGSEMQREKSKIGLIRG